MPPLQHPLRQLVELHPPPESPVLPELPPLLEPELPPELLPEPAPLLLPVLPSPLPLEDPSSAASPPPSCAPPLSLVPLPLVAHAPFAVAKARTSAPQAHADECFMCQSLPAFGAGVRSLSACGQP
jgi:hypothetical protein